ncbi:MAG: LPS export ABC transporter periplasmic protein LptC [Deltaproteobacteria bacterium]|nr:LPS export ABC transporter periplasmic protein LptC [Deltaproteobacteria bacterium]
MIRMRTVLVVLIALMLAGLAAGLWRLHRLQKDPGDILAVMPEHADVTLHHIRHVATRDGRKQWSLNADSVRYKKAGNLFELENVRVTFYLKDGQSVQVTGDHGVFCEDTKQIEISGNVLVLQADRKMRTDRLRYDDERQAISTDTPVTLEGDGIRLTGRNLAFSFATEQAVVWGNVDAVISNMRL